ncbi:MAG: hypothetical protein GF332_04715 [Candidatus Moranbacteria bacterium]|nr:hypothetical protein [Candidatus Moranbacteria bacterium]
MKKIMIFFVLMAFLGCSKSQTVDNAENQPREQKNKQNQQQPNMNDMNDMETMRIQQMNEESDNNEDAMQEQGYIDVAPKKAKELIDQNPEIIIIDVSSNYAQGHIPGAINHYVGDGSLDKAIQNLAKDKTYLVYCHNETASRLGAKKLTDAGISKVYRLDGDYPAWVKAGYEVEK